jgi:hypothetical protein
MNPGHSANITFNFGDEIRGSTGITLGSLFTTSQTVTDRLFTSMKFNFYPGASFSEIFDNYTSKGTENRLYTSETGWPVVSFHSLKTGEAATYNLSKVREFAIEVDGCKVINRYRNLRTHGEKWR